VLYPLNGLRNTFPDLYERERIKYDQRESVMEFLVPGLGVGWADTVNLSALDPRLLVAERRRLDVPFSHLLTRRLVCIPVERLAGLPAVRYDSATHWINSSPGDPSVPLTPPEHEFSAFDVSGYHEATEVPAPHRQYLLRQKARGERALGFVFVPHVLVAAAIDVSGLPLLEL
jgi:hypothetical protein